MLSEQEHGFKSMHRIKEFLADAEKIGKLQQQSTAGKIPVISRETASILESVCFIAKPVNILEIGCGNGYSTYFLTKHFFLFMDRGTDAGRDHMSDIILCYTGIDLNRERLSHARDFITGLFSDKSNNEIPANITLEFIPGNALKVIPGLSGYFDMVFIDAAKFQYPDYIKAVEGKLSDGCIIIADNIFYSNKVLNNNIGKHDKNSVNGLRNYIKFILGNDHYSTDFINTGDGIAISIFKKDS